MSTTKKSNTKVLVECALLIAIATVLNVVCSFIPFLNLPFGGGFTICSMLPIVLAAYRNGTKWGLLTGFVYAVVQMLLGFKTVSAFFMPSSDSYMVLWKAICVCLIDYIIAYTVPVSYTHRPRLRRHLQKQDKESVRISVRRLDSRSFAALSRPHHLRLHLLRHMG